MFLHQARLCQYELVLSILGLENYDALSLQNTVLCFGLLGSCPENEALLLTSP